MTWGRRRRGEDGARKAKGGEREGESI